MDREKINDAADTAFLENYFPSATESPDPRWDMFADGFKQGTDWLMQQPLSERLTEEEKEKIRAKYNELKSLNSISNEMFADDTAILDWLFGKDLFTNQPTAR